MSSNEFQRLADFLGFLRANQNDHYFSEEISEQINLPVNEVRVIADNAILNQWVNVDHRTDDGNPAVQINADGNRRWNQLTENAEALPAQGNVTNINVNGENINIGTGNTVNSGDVVSPTKNALAKYSSTIALVVGIFVIAGVILAFVEYIEPSEITVKTDVGIVPILKDIRDVDESKIYPIGDTIIDDTLVSNSYGFVISRPNVNWNIIYDPVMISNNDFIQIVNIENKNRLETISISKIENIPKDYELLIEQRIKITYSDLNGYNFKEYPVNENGSKVYSWAFNSCEENICSDYIVVEILKLTDDDLFRVLSFSQITDPNTKGAISSETYEILNSFKIIE